MIVWNYQVFKAEGKYVVARVRYIHEHRVDLDYVHIGAYDGAPIKFLDSWEEAVALAEYANKQGVRNAD